NESIPRVLRNSPNLHKQTATQYLPMSRMRLNPTPIARTQEDSCNFLSRNLGDMSTHVLVRSTFVLKMLGSVAISAMLTAGTSALANERAIIVFDGSGSMWGQIEGKPKHQI